MSKTDAILLAAGASAISSTTGAILPVEVALYWYCLSGAILGAIFVASLPGKDEPTARQLATRILASVAFGVGFAPGLIRSQGWGSSPETVLAVSAAFGVLAWLAGRFLASLTTSDIRDAFIWLRDTAVAVLTMGRGGKGGDRG
jgi:hypothetical protein